MQNIQVLLYSKNSIEVVFNISWAVVSWFLNSERQRDVRQCLVRAAQRLIFLSLVYAAQWWAIWVIGSRLLSFSRRRTRLRCYYFFCKHGREHRFVLRHWYNVLPHCKNIKVCINNSVGRRFGARKANGKASNGSVKERYYLVWIRR